MGTNNPYLQSQIDATLGDVTRNYNLAVKPNTETAMARSGSFGNSGLQQLQSEQERQLAQTLGNTANNMRMQDYNNQQNMYQWDQNFNRQVFNDGVSQNQQNLSNYMGLMNQANQFNQQDIANQTAMYNAPLSYQQQFSNMANAAGGLGGTSGVSQTGSSSPLLGALGGWGLGSNVASFFQPTKSTT
ncbi:hypothetical protein [uncultured Rhodoferax sp.]|uniref:hypothetical protein n=1 Tax=uncultured Rhodoferax sp. TaxID=223188 RepID=UPI0025D516CA|nr:hypothetical protein [uncultured Rhodoferax sp.]